MVTLQKVHPLDGDLFFFFSCFYFFYFNMFHVFVMAYPTIFHCFASREPKRVLYRCACAARVEYVCLSPFKFFFFLFWNFSSPPQFNFKSQGRFHLNAISHLCNLWHYNSEIEFKFLKKYKEILHKICGHFQLNKLSKFLLKFHENCKKNLINNFKGI